MTEELKRIEELVIGQALSQVGMRSYLNGDPLKIHPDHLRRIISLTLDEARATPAPASDLAELPEPHWMATQSFSAEQVRDFGAQQREVGRGEDKAESDKIYGICMNTAGVDALHARIAGLESALAAVPANPPSGARGWQLVPIMPTAAMIDAAAAADPERESVWAAYLAAAPALPEAPEPAQQSAQERVEPINADLLVLLLREGGVINERGAMQLLNGDGMPITINQLLRVAQIAALASQEPR